MTRYVPVLALALLLAASSAALSVTVVVNHQVLPADPPAVERDGRVLLPLRTVFEALQATVGWDGPTRTVFADREGRTVRMTIGSRTAYVDGAPVTLDVPPRLIGPYTYVPVRFPAEAFGADVVWEGASRTVRIALGLPGVAPVSGHSPPVVHFPREGDRVGPRTEVSLQATPGVMQVIWTVVRRADTGEEIRSVPGIRHVTEPDGSYRGAIATPRLTLGDLTVPIYYEIHFRNGADQGAPVTVVTCYPAD